MPSQTELEIPPFPSNVPTADISIVDFDELAQGNDEQAKTVLEACRGYGFFYIKNHHVDSNFMFDLANSVFSLPYDEKMKYDMGTTGNYFGYKQSGGSYVDDKGTPDKSEFYNISKDDILSVNDTTPLPHPAPINAARAPLETFMRSSHRVVQVIIQVLERQLGLPPATLTALHRLDRCGGDQARVTHAPPAPSNVITLGEHTDFGSVTVLFNQLGGLQVLSPRAREWRYVAPQPGCALINLGDAIVKMVGGQLYSGVHRVVGPPGAQAASPRHSVVYFARPNGDVRLASVFGDAKERELAPTADEWIAKRAMLRSSANFKGPETMRLSRGTEHHKDDYQGAPALDKPAASVEAV